MATSVSLKEYLKKYEAGGGGGDVKEKKRKKKKDGANTKMPSSAGGVLIVDEDPTWQKPVILDEPEYGNGSSEEDRPIVEEDIEVKRLRRLQQIQAQKPYLSVSEDGSGWVAVSDNAERGRDLSSAKLDLPSPNNDLSPPRQRGRRHFHTPSPETKPRLHGSPEASLSPQIRRSVEEDLSPPRKGRHDSAELDMPRGSSPEADLSPLKRNRRSSLEDISPPRRVQRDSSPGLEEADLSLPRKSRRGSQDDIKTHRQVHQRSVEPRGSAVEDISPPRRRIKGGHDSLELVEARQSLSSGISPTRGIKPKVPANEVDRKGGLFSRGEIKEVIDKKKSEDLSRLASLDPVKSGIGAEPVYRNQGKRVSKEEKLKLQKGEEKPKEKKLEWGKGLTQKWEAEAKAKEIELEKEKPFARTRDDPELDKMLKERVRWGDPMAHLAKKNSEPALQDLGDDEKMKESGFIIPQSIPSHSWIKRGIDPPPNRYGIKPGRHWDGVDRSTGYEKELFKRQNDKRATQTEAYLWSVADM